MPISTRTHSPSTGPSLTRRSGYVYERRRPHDSAVYQVVRENLETLYAAVESGFATAPLPKFVRDELEKSATAGIAGGLMKGPQRGPFGGIEET